MTIKYVKISIPNLKRNQIYVSHVGDGEYRFNVFGNAFDDLLKLWAAISETYHKDINDFEVVGATSSYTGKVNMNEFYIKCENQLLARITVETLNPPVLYIGA